jgi:ethanolamine utilization protein EutN
VQLALVIGTVTATVKHETLRGTKLMIVQPQLADGVSADGDPLVAVDAVGAGCGETVMITSDGLFARQWLKTDATPVRWTIVGIKD